MGALNRIVHWWDRRGLRTQIRISLIVVNLVSLVGFVAVFAWVMRAEVIDNQMRSLRQQAAVGLSSVVAAYEVGGTSSLQETLELFRTSAQFDSVAIYDANGALIASLVAPGQQAFPGRLRQLLSARTRNDFPPMLTLPLVRSDGKRALGDMVLRGNTERFKESWLEAVALFALIAAVGLQLIALLSLFVGRRLSRSLTDLTQWAASTPLTNASAVASPEVAGREVRALKQAFLHLVTKLDRQNIELRELSKRLREENLDLERTRLLDPLTGVPNRVAAEQELDARLASAASAGGAFAVAFVDLDDFKSINDEFGHLTGDRALKATTSRLRRALSERDVVARYAGDEFLVLVDGIATAEDAERCKKSLLAELSDVGQGDGWPAPIRASIGLACYPVHGNNAATLVAEADRAMYRNKIQDSQHLS